MSDWTPDWKLSVAGIDYENIAIADIAHQAGRDDIYTQPNPSYLQVEVVALSGQTLPFDINDSLSLQVKNSTGSFINIFGGDITDISIKVAQSGNRSTVVSYTLLAMGSLVKLAKEIYSDTLSKDFDGDQMFVLLSYSLTNTWNEVPSAEDWANYDATTTWANAENIGLGEVDRPGLFEMENRSAEPDTVYNIASIIADSALGYLYEDSQGNIGYADADHRQTYLSANGYTEVSANTALSQGLQTTIKAADIRNDIYINYGNNFGSQATATDANSIANYGYKAETINSVIHDSDNAQEVADRYITLRSAPYPVFDSITFPITNSEIDDADRDALLGIFMGQPIHITDLPSQFQNSSFEGYVEGWRWATRFNELFLTINLSPVNFSQVAMRWNTVPINEAWNTLSGTLDWYNANIVA
jgi:hypothetical protein